MCKPTLYIYDGTFEKANDKFTLDDLYTIDLWIWMDTKRYFINSWMIRWCWKMRETKRGGNVTGLGPDCVPGSWPELTLAALQFRQEPPFPVNKSAHISWLVRFSLSLPSSIDNSFVLRHHLLACNSPRDKKSFKKFIRCSGSPLNIPLRRSAFKWAAAFLLQRLII